MRWLVTQFKQLQTTCFNLTDAILLECTLLRWRPSTLALSVILVARKCLGLAKIDRPEIMAMAGKLLA